MDDAQIYLARNNLLAFVKLTMSGYSCGWVHREICARLMKFFIDVQEKRSPRMIITMPPRHGKSELVSRRFPAWCLGVNPNISLISASYSDDLARRMNKDVQRIMESDVYTEIFPWTRITDARKGGAVRTTGLFEIPNFSGCYRSAGVGGGLTGMGCDILSIDDPLKDRQSADSPTIRSRVWDWYTSTAYTRLSPGGGVLITQTRWHEDDLAGKLISQMGEAQSDQFTVVNYPAIAETDETHRHEGEALHPERFDLDKLNQIKANIGEYDWAALYQQRPAPRGGAIFKREWIRHWDKLPTAFDEIIQSWDFTFKDGTHSDNVAGTVWGVIGADYYLLDLVCDKMDFISQIRAMSRLTAKHPRATAKVVEDKANGSAIISALRDKIAGIVPFTPNGSKQARAYAISPLFESGNVLIPPKNANYPWVSDYLSELLAFPAATHDDRVDSTTQALIYLSEKRQKRGIVGWL